jgi:hypothetical protein
MLILTRRVGESVVIGTEVTVTVLRVKGNQVRLGVDAPKSVQREGGMEQGSDFNTDEEPGDSNGT